MKKRIKGLAITGLLLFGCVPPEEKYDHEIVEVGDVLDKMSEICSSTASDVDSVVCPIATDTGLEGYMRLRCWVSAQSGTVDCIETTNERTCRSFTSGDMCKRAFEASSVSCGFDESYEVYKPDLSRKVVKGKVRSDNEFECSTIGAY